MKFFLKLGITLLTLLSLSCKQNDAPRIDSTDYTLQSLTLGISFPPVSDAEQRNFTQPILDELEVRPIRIAEEWSLREPTQGNFSWSPLDDRVNWATANDYQLLLTIQSDGPDWACSQTRNIRSCVYADNADFQNYVEVLLQRYPDKIDKIQFGNEWQSEWWYAGNAMEFVQASNIVYEAIQLYSPSTKFVLGGFTTISLRYLAACNGFVSSFYDDEGNFFDQAYLDINCGGADIQQVVKRINYVLGNAQYDELDIHLYDDVDQWDEYYFYFKSMVAKPIIVTEFGGPNVNLEPLYEEYQAQQIEKYIRKLDSLGIYEGYFFKLVEGSTNPAHITSGLIRASSLENKLAFGVFKKFSTNQ